MGLENSGPVTKGEKLNSVFKVYVRRMVQLNLGPNLRENRAEVEPRKLDFKDNYIDHMPGGDLHGSATGTLTLKQDWPPYTPILPSSFNKEYIGDEDDVHRELARDLGVSFAENNISMVNMMNEVDNRNIIFAPAAVMGMDQNDS